jgi:biopolymer transport protein ExbB
MVDRLLNMALLGGEPILYVLIALSFLSIAVVIERYAVYYRNRIDLPDFTSKTVGFLNKGKLTDAFRLAKSNDSAEAQVAQEGLANFDKGATVTSELMDSMTMKQQQRLDKRLTILGTVGSNAPFVGLLGTVLGIIKAFNDLALNSEGGPSVVMGGIAEALVATAIGLLVAIPAVVFFNYFKSRQKTILSNIEQLKMTLLAFIGNESSNGHTTPENKAA